MNRSVKPEQRRQELKGLEGAATARIGEIYHSDPNQLFYLGGTMIRNFTPHPIRVLAPVGVSYDPKARKYQLVGDPVIIADIPSDGVLSAHFVDTDAGSIDNVPLIRKAVGQIDPTPPGDDFIIVSTVYANAAKAASPALASVVNTDRLLTVGDVVFQDGRPIGCLSLVRV